MSVILLPGFYPLRSLHVLDNATHALHGKQVVVDIDGKEFGLAVTLMRRAGRYSPEIVYRGGTDLLSNMSHDGNAFPASGFTPEWTAGYRKNLGLTYSMFKQSTDQGHEAQVTARLSKGAMNEGVVLARRVLLKAQTAEVRGLFVSQVSDLQSAGGLYRALGEIAAKAKTPLLSTQLASVGIDQATLDRVAQLADEMHQGVTTKSEARAGKIGARDPMLAASAMLLGDMSLVCTAAKADLGPERAKVYRLGHFLGIPSRRGKGKATPATDTGTQPQTPPGMQAPTPGTHAPAHHTTHGHPAAHGHTTAHGHPATHGTPATPVLTTPPNVAVPPVAGAPGVAVAPGAVVPPGVAVAPGGSTPPVAPTPPIAAAPQTPAMPPPHQPSHRHHKRHGAHAGPPRKPKHV